MIRKESKHTKIIKQGLNNNQIRTLAMLWSIANKQQRSMIQEPNISQ